MEVYRIARWPYIADLSGEGSRRYGGRWNSIGIPALYAASHRSLAMLEVLAYTPFELLQGFGLATIWLPDDAPYLKIGTDDLPTGWDAFPSRRSSALMGNHWLQEKHYLGVWVPSCLLPEEYNLVINPAHVAMQQARVVASRPLEFSARFKSPLL
jgi:RES domain-containing protein